MYLAPAACGAALSRNGDKSGRSMSTPDIVYPIDYMLHPVSFLNPLTAFNLHFDTWYKQRY